jgi:hypothetical protein
VAGIQLFGSKKLLELWFSSANRLKYRVASINAHINYQSTFVLEVPANQKKMLNFTLIVSISQQYSANQKIVSFFRLAKIFRAKISSII